MELISRSEAKEQGLKRYFTGKPCPLGHVLDRFVLDYGCVECSRLKGAAWRKKNPEIIKELTAKNAEKAAAKYRENREPNRIATSKYAKKHRAKCNAKLAAYRASKEHRTPAWSDLDKIKELYELSAKLTRETKIPHEVDHIIPLQGELVSGLHVFSNLQIITQFHNRTKSNKFNSEEYNQCHV